MANTNSSAVFFLGTRAHYQVGQLSQTAAQQGPLQIKPEFSDVSAISVTSRIPEFWTDQPRVWFIRAEAVLGPQKTADEAQFQIVVSKLGKEAVKKLLRVGC
ncbi:unnamed protein product [Pieris macdunnoughi]|uniref:DUF7041 domain-containing protein n=1 Tax=Pieris macdunnoughi TaxID=345717 RepID=A0A821KZD2_9NEOP|nr:unnamed protein product [Pieris macdunnoughi]